MDYQLNLIAGTDIPIPECQLTVHQPTIRELSYIGEEAFYTGARFLCIDKIMLTEDELDLLNRSNFQIFMTIMNAPEAKEKKIQVMQVLQMLLPDFNCVLSPRAIICARDGTAPLMIDDNNFEVFQQVLATMFCLNGGGDQPVYNPQSEKAKEIAAKLMRGRQRVAAQKQGDSSSVLAQYLSVLSVGLHISLNELLDMTIYQIYDLLQRYNLYVAWDIDLRSRLAGGKPDGEPENWMKSIH